VLTSKGDIAVLTSSKRADFSKRTDCLIKGGYIAMFSRYPGDDFVTAWPTAEPERKESTSSKSTSRSERGCTFFQHD